MEFSRPPHTPILTYCFLMTKSSMWARVDQKAFKVSERATVVMGSSVVFSLCL